MPSQSVVTPCRRWLWVLCAVCAVSAADPPEIRVELEPSITAVLQGGVKLYVECTLSPGGDGRGILGRLMANSGDWRFFLDRSLVRIPYSRLNPVTQRRVLQTLFPEDIVDARGWRHVVTVDGAEGAESPFALAEWLTGRGTHAAQFRLENGSRLPDGPLRKGMVITMPYAFLLPHMRPATGGGITPQAPPPVSRESRDSVPLLPKDTKQDIGPLQPSVSVDKPEPAVVLPLPPVEDATPVESASAVPGPAGGASSDSPSSTGAALTYGQDKKGRYAEYRLQPGESLYTAVVIRFTDIREHREILKACDEIIKCSGIRDISRMPAGQRVRIPLDMLSAEYLPEDAPQRQEFEEVRQKARVLRGRTPRTRNLKGVVVVIDPGHGGVDPGAKWQCLYEDEVVYDIASRLKEILETRSAAKVYMTVLDESQQYVPVAVRNFTHDTDEFVQVTPRYHIADNVRSVELRYALANHIMRKELKAGTPEEKMVFISIHVDSIENPRVRGTTVYVPAARLMGEIRTSKGSFKELQQVPPAHLSRKKAQIHEALSRNLAEQIVTSLRRSTPPIATLSHGDPVRNTIRKGRSNYVPAVLKHNLIPTRVLVETANIQSPRDRGLLCDPSWRQRYAEALYTALCRYFE